jgi:hypothetical protein
MAKTNDSGLPKIPEHKAQEEDPQYPFKQRRVLEAPTGPKDFKEDHTPRPLADFQKRDGHPSLYQEDPIEEQRELSIEVTCMEEPHWE